MEFKGRILPTVGVLGLALLSACGTTSTSSSGGGNTCSGTVKVATDLPVSGADATDGKPTENGAKLAVDQAKAKNLLEGCTIVFVPKDDVSVALGKHDPNQGAANISTLASDNAVVGVVGPFNSSVAKAEMPIANNAGLVLISPSNTNPGLTQVGADPTVDTKALRPTGNITYFRVCTTDIKQGGGLAKAALDTAHAKKAFVIDDQETYGQGLASEFTKGFKAGGGTVVDAVHLPGTTKDFRDTLNKAKTDGADVVFFGGTSSNGGGIIKNQMATILPNVPLFGGDGIVDDQFITDAGSNSDGAYGTVAGPDATKLDSAKQFVADYKAAYNADPGAYSANAYDAMSILLQATKKAIDDNGGTLPTDPKALRAAVVKDVAGIDYQGAIGHTTFDSNGDTTNIVLTLFETVKGKWTAISNVTL